MSELYFSWPVTIPFWIIHVDLWSPGVTDDISGHNIHLLNDICDLTQFVVSSTTEIIDAKTLAQLFMSEVVLTFVIFSIVMIDDGSTFKSVFISMCDALNIHY